MKTTIRAAAAVVTLSAASAVHAQQAVQWRVQDGGNGHWYRLVIEGSPSWTDAKLLAEQRGGHLATLTSQPEVEFVAQLGAGAPPMIVGGYQDRGSASFFEPLGGWRWVTDEPWAYTNWMSGEPNNQDNGHGDPNEDFLYCWVYPQGLRWSDGDNFCPECNPYAFLVEWSADCNNDGVVDYGQILDGTFPDANGNGVPDCCDGGGSCTPCPGDVASDGMVDGVDLAAVLSQWGTQGSGTFNADIDGSGLVDGGDLGIVLGGWGPCPQ